MTAPDLLDDIPGDRPVLAVAEGLTMYLSEVDGIALLRRITVHFAVGSCSSTPSAAWGPGVQRLNPAVVHAGVHLRWGIDDPQSLESSVPGLRLVTEWPFTDAPELDRYAQPVRAAIRASGRITAVRRMAGCSATASDSAGRRQVQEPVHAGRLDREVPGARQHGQFLRPRKPVEERPAQLHRCPGVLDGVRQARHPALAQRAAPPAARRRSGRVCCARSTG
ncbi:hypothetical protein [Saccharopolyspora sp. ASAGF58]|uniref:hypothetical protein n=1 Tax=Saccharopolyspora sp. ASAGF58 TaxID=2719023 RepID=UPI001FF0BA34|nr:hypothetical protein [Saccharopolyspora sp. ASAGF58]